METMERDVLTIDADLIRSRFTRALCSYDRNADAQHRISRKLAGLLPRYTGAHYQRILEIGCGTGGFTRCLKSCCNIQEWVLNDLCEACREKTADIFDGTTPAFIAGDAERISFPGSFDLIASASAFQWMRQPEQFLHNLAGILKPQGVLLFSTFAPNNLHEIKELTGNGLSYPSVEELHRWLSADYRLLHTEEEKIVLTFDNPLEVLRHMKATGVTATAEGCWTRSRQEEFCRRYRELFQTTHHKVTLTYRPVYLLAVKK